VAISVSAGVVFQVGERSLRTSSARVADDFPLVVGAPGSQTQLVLTAVYLDLEALPLVPGNVIKALGADRRVRDAAPMAFGDVVGGLPVIGTTAAMVTRWGKLGVQEGRLFAAENEAVVGADVPLGVGATVTPQHGRDPLPFPSGAAQGPHVHEGSALRIVGRMARANSAWDRAILVPIESVWSTHGLGDGHATEGSPIGPPFDADPMPGAPVVVVRPVSFAAAYALRASYRAGGTMAVFPAEILVSLYKTLGDVGDILALAARFSSLLLIAALLLLMLAIVGLRRQRYAVLRALGAPPAYVFVVIWAGTVTLILVGCAAGVLLGWTVAGGLAATLRPFNGLVLVFQPMLEDVLFALQIAGIGALLATLPALGALRVPIADGLRG
jgi:putative ABC transport system permease protein